MKVVRFQLVKVLNSKFGFDSCLSSEQLAHTLRAGWNDRCKACMMCAEFDGEPTPASSGVSVSGNKLRVNNKISGSGVLTDDDHRSR